MHWKPTGREGEKARCAENNKSNKQYLIEAVLAETKAQIIAPLLLNRTEMNRLFGASKPVPAPV